MRTPARDNGVVGSEEVESEFAKERILIVFRALLKRSFPGTRLPLFWSCLGFGLSEELLETRIVPQRVPLPAMAQIVGGDGAVGVVDRAGRSEE